MLGIGSVERRSQEIGLNDRRLLEMLGLDVAPGEVNIKGWNALKVDTIFACIKVLSDAISKLPLKVYQEDEYGITKSASHYLYRLLKLRPNPYMSAADFWKATEAHRAMGNAYASIEFDKRTGKVVALWPMDSSKVKVIIDDAGILPDPTRRIVSSQTRLWYEVDVGNGEKRKLLPDEVLHFKGAITLDGLIGVRTMDYLQTTAENAASAGKFINNFYKQGLQVKGLVQYTGTLDEGAKKVFKDNFEGMTSGLKNSHRVALMPYGYQFTPISISMADAQFMQNTELTFRQIANAFGVKMHQLNDLSKATYSNVEQQQLAFISDTHQPILTTYEQELTYKLFIDQELDAGYFCKFNVDATLRSDLKTRYEAYRTAIQAGFLKPNEARAKEDMEPAAGGDQLLFNGSVIPLTMAGLQYVKGGEETEPEEDKPDSDKGEEGNSGDVGDPGDGSDGGGSK
ncbi:phage portal protein [Paenibacillus sp. 19GGS1-52]|uniref:phage portal protein n=1 Tax=Paenibacillus sp. 19GGS1-52 TaxID=2758563 RepID=UPI001EFADBD8|nr:phage portal protein [Paenibacillus sp. 19GGS1-52]ULO10271.1 phage portal protein [Paenibacillus sp. 19GGS1-52]